MGRKSDARGRLIEAAIEMIWRVSYGEITVDALCGRAKVKKGTFYHFFDSKPDFVHAALSAWWAPREAAFAEMMQLGIPPLERIAEYANRLVSAQMEQYDSDGYIHGTPIFRLGSEISMHHEALRLFITRYIAFHLRFFEEAIKDAQESGQIGAGDASFMARLLWGYNISTMTRAHIEQNPELIRNLGADLRNLINSPLFTSDLEPQNRANHDARSPAPVDLERGTIRRIEADGEKRRTLEDLALMGECADLMIVLTDVQGRINWANDTFLRTCGYSLEELLGKKPGKILQGPESDPVAIKTFHDAVQSATPFACEIINYKKDGTPYPVFISILPRFDNGIHQGFIAVEQDLSAGKGSARQVIPKESVVDTK